MDIDAIKSRMTTTQPTPESCHQTHTYLQPFELVYAAYLSRFPRHPKLPELMDSVYSNRQYFDDGARETFGRVTTLSSNEVPWLVRKATGIDTLQFESECVLDWARREYIITSKNVTMRSKVTIDEVGCYRVHDENPDYTWIEQSVTLSIPGLPSSLAKILVKFLGAVYIKGAIAGRLLDEELIVDYMASGKTAADFPIWAEREENKLKLKPAVTVEGRTSSEKHVSLDPSPARKLVSSGRRKSLASNASIGLGLEEAQAFLCQKFGADVDSVAMERMWEQEDLAPDELISVARLLVVYSEQFGAPYNADQANEVAGLRSRQRSGQRDRNWSCGADSFGGNGSASDEEMVGATDSERSLAEHPTIAKYADVTGTASIDEGDKLKITSALDQVATRATRTTAAKEKVLSMPVLLLWSAEDIKEVSIKFGWLYSRKRALHGRGFKQRWFALVRCMGLSCEQLCLVYYKHETDLRPRGLIPLLPRNFTVDRLPRDTRKLAHVCPYGIQLNVSLTRGRDPNMRFRSSYTLALLNEKDIVDWFEVLVTLPTALPESQMDALPSMLPLSSGRQKSRAPRSARRDYKSTVSLSGYWAPDDSTHHCASCQTAFKSRKRRHHCRNCGQIFCKGCSSARAELPGFVGQQRLCRGCIGSMQAPFSPTDTTAVEDAAGAAPEGESDEPMAKRELTWPGGEDGSSDSGTDEEDEEDKEEESVAANRALSNSSIGSVYKLERFASADDGAAGPRVLSDDDSDDDDDDDDEFEDCDAGVEHDDVAPSAEPGPESFALRKRRTMSHALINVDEWASSLPEEAALGEEGGDDPLALLDMLERQLRAEQSSLSSPVQAILANLRHAASRTC